MAGIDCASACTEELIPIISPRWSGGVDLERTKQELFGKFFGKKPMML